MNREQFIEEYGKAWERIFKQVFYLPLVNDYVKQGWNAVYKSISNDGWDETPELWKMLAWKATCEYLNEIRETMNTV